MSAKSPRIAYLTSEYPTVSHTFILREVEALRELGADVITCSVRSIPPEQIRGPAERAAADSTYYLLRDARRLWPLLRAQRRAGGGAYWRALALAWRTCPPGLKNRLWQAFYFLEATLLADWLMRKGATRIHNHFTTNSATVAMLAGVLTGLPYSMMMHGPTDFLDPEHWRLDEKIARADFVSCISHFARSQGMFFSDYADWDRLRIVHCGVRPETYGGGDPGPGTRLLFVGRLAAQKGLPVLLEAFAQAHAARPDLTLTLAGDGPDRAMLEQMAERLNLPVRFTGYLSQDQVADTLRAADVFVLPSFAEGVPVVLMEAMASRLPVIATRVAGVAELVEDGVSGRLVSAGDAEGLTQAILSVAADPAAQAAMGAAGRARVEAEFDIRAEAARLYALFTGSSGPDIRPPAP